jgi:CheY-like chemotaxis protein
LDFLTRDSFLEYLRDALTHLYNADYLRKSPLTDLFNIANRFDTSSALRKILIDAIYSFKPALDESDQSRAWRIFDSLFCCYVQQLNQQVVADQLCISPRQLRREQHYALEALADYLWSQFKLDANIEPPLESKKENPDVADQFTWLNDMQPDHPTDLNQEMINVLELTRPLSALNQTVIANHITQTTPALAIHPTVLNQILVNLVSIAITLAGSGGSVELSVNLCEWTVEILIQTGTSSSPDDVLTDEQVGSLKIADQLVKLSGGELVYEKQPVGIFVACITIPKLDQFPVLVIDDNADTLQLFKRYCACSRYHLICTRDTDEAMGLIEQYHPQIIVLDIMMPKDNGWMVLSKLRQQPDTRQIPILICTILPQEKLALSLGASGFIKKPVARTDFLHALDQQYAQMEPEQTRDSGCS